MSGQPLRDRFAHATCNWIINHVATRNYRQWVTVAMRLGMEDLDSTLLGKRLGPTHRAVDDEAFKRLLGSAE